MPRLVKDRIGELLMQRAMDPEICELTCSLSYNSGVEDVLEALEPLELAVLFDQPPDQDPDRAGIAIMPEAYLRIKEALRDALEANGYEPRRTSPVLDAVLEALVGDREVTFVLNKPKLSAEEIAVLGGIPGEVLVVKPIRVGIDMSKEGSE